MKPIVTLLLLTVLISTSNGLMGLTKHKEPSTTSDHRVLSNVKIYSNLAEIIQPLKLLPLEFTEDEWKDIRTDSVTLVGTNVNVSQQTITEKKKSFNNAQVYVRSPTSSNTETKFIRATLIDEHRNLVKLTDKDISTEPVYLTVSSDNIVYDSEPQQSKYYVNFTYDTTEAVYLSYLRSNLNWKTRYQLNLFDEAKGAVLIAMADIRNDGNSRVDIENAELLGGDINLQMHHQHFPMEAYQHQRYRLTGSAGGDSAEAAPPTVARGEELAGLYVFAINKPFSIDAKTNYLLPMFRPHVTVERYNLISKSFYRPESSTGKSQRSYRLSSDHFLSNGNCIMREFDRLVGETPIPDLAAKDKHQFSIGEDADITYKENVTVVSTRTYNETSRRNSIYTQAVERTESVYNVNVLFKNFKKNRPVKIEYEQHVHAHTLKLTTPNPFFTQEDSSIKCKLTLAAGEEKSVSYKFERVV